MFKSGSVELWETGLLKGLEAKWMGKRLNEPNSDPLHTVVLSLGQMMLVFSILGAAILLSIIILGIEVFWNYIKNSGIPKYFTSLKSWNIQSKSFSIYDISVVHFIHSNLVKFLIDR